MDRKKPCYHFAKGSCKFGDNCKYSHVVTARNATVRPQRDEQETELDIWLRSIPRPRPSGAIRTLNRKELAEFFRTAVGLLDLQRDAIIQQVVKNLGTENGLQLVQSVTLEFSRCSDLERTPCFTSIVVPFLQCVTHRDILKSILLESTVGTIFTVLYGNSGSRGIPFFRNIAAVLQDQAYVDNKSNSLALSATLVAILKMIETNQAASVQPEFPSIIEVIEAAIAAQGPYSLGTLPMQHSITTLSKVKTRLNLGGSMPDFMTARSVAPATLPSFSLDQDGPGSLSTEGPRHDNDHKNISSIKILPTAREIASTRLEYLPVTDPTKHHLSGLSGLLDRQFRLLREDTIGQLRDCVKSVSESLTVVAGHLKGGNRVQHGARMFVYENVIWSDIIFDTHKGLRFAVEFDQPSAVAKLNTEKQRQAWWDDSKQMQIDSLVCLVDSEGRAFFLSISDREQKSKTPEPSNSVQDDTNITGRSPVTASSDRSLWQDQRRSAIMLQSIDEDESELLQMLGQRKEADLRQVIVEFPGILLASFRPTLEALQRMAEHRDVPFTELIAPPVSANGSVVHGMADVPLPAYATQPGFYFNLGAIANSGPLRLVPGQRFDIDTLTARTSLDNAQALALVNGLSRSLALCQGPPGTGKSYVAVQMVRILLECRERAELGPIICVCYTNHALDQFLEHLVAGGTENVIRIGGRSKSTVLGPLNLRNVTSDLERTKTEKHQAWKSRTELEEMGIKVISRLDELKRAESYSSIKAYLEESSPHHHRELFQDTNDDDFVMVKNKRRNPIQRWLGTSPALHSGHLRPLRVLQFTSLSGMSKAEKRILYEKWICDIKYDLSIWLSQAVAQYRSIKESLTNCYREVDLRCLKKAHVIGITTTGLAKNIELLSRLESKVLLCEEAGEILEAHTITALLPSVEHAILIGDHEQLRPQVQNYELSLENPRGLKYSLDVSLFERLIRPPTQAPGQRLPYDTLAVQRRMHPSIARLVRDTLYSQLQDHDCVQGYPDVGGMKKRLFWLDHREYEVTANTSEFLQTSHSNDYEVQMAGALVTHLVRQGLYKSEEIAVLTPYVRQLQKIREHLSRSFEIVVGDRDEEELKKELLEEGSNRKDLSVINTSPAHQLQRASLLHALRVATVDNFQGEEAKIVIVSLVRSNAHNRCGFLKTSNRINVLLSRAKHGLYVLGNAETAGVVAMWGKVISILSRNGNIGTSLALCCPRHPETTIEVATPDDFARLSPEGGCQLQCSLRHHCGHACTFKCHSGLRHDGVICPEPCPRRWENCDHACPRKCGEPCDSVCRVFLEDLRLPCGHIMGRLECFKSQDLTKVKCTHKVNKVVPGCLHEVIIDCSRDPSNADYRCRATCNAELPCGHKCLQQCQSCNIRDDGIIASVNHGLCNARCGRPYATCSHGCLRSCHGTEACPPCELPCAVKCSHSTCGKQCYEPCAPCAENCTAGCRHQGKCQMPCAVPCDILPCSLRCEIMLVCGHRCPSMCGEICPSSKFCQTCASPLIKQIMADYISMESFGDVDLDESPVLVPQCGHLLTKDSMDAHMEMSKHYEMSDQGQPVAIVAGSYPFSIEDLKSCPMCRAPLRSLNRYNRIVKRGLLDEATKRFTLWSNARFVPLTERMFQEEERLNEENIMLNDPQQMAITNADFSALVPGKRGAIPGFRYAQIHAICSLSGLAHRQSALFALRREIVAFKKQVSEEEQPHAKVYNMVENLRRLNIQSSFKRDVSILQTRGRLLATALLIRCELCIFSDFVRVYKEQKPNMRRLHAWMREDLNLDLAQNRSDCLKLAESSIQGQQPMQEIEARLYFVRFVVLERSMPAASEDGDEAATHRLVKQANEQLQLAKAVFAASGNLPNISSMHGEIDATEKMLRGGTFYTAFTNEEKRAVYAAMAQELRGTGHWYYCENGHPFTVGECGMPMQTSRCPQCNAPIGGQSHQSVEGVRHARDMDEEFGRLAI